MNHPSLLLQASTPTQSSLSFCDASPREMKHWIASLPKANLGETARLLYQGLVELNQLVTPSDNRLQLLELLRPEVHYVCKHLERHFLNQSIVLDERPRKVANLCQALHTHLAMGYKQIVARLAGRAQKDRAPLLSVALQRAVRSLTIPLIHSSQFYKPVPEGLWLEMHQLYQIAVQHQIHTTAVANDLSNQTPTLSIEQAYIVALLMGCSRCNQMRQNNIAQLAEVLELWSTRVTLQCASLPGSLFAVAPGTDAPARYASLFPKEQRGALLGMDTSALVEAMKQYLQLPPGKRSQSHLPVPTGFSLDVLQHLCAAWGEAAERTFRRTPGQGNMTLCIGISALHFYLSGKRSFSDILRRPLNTRPAHFKALSASNAKKDEWEFAFDAQRPGRSEHMLPFEEIEYQSSEAENTHSSAQDAPSYDLEIIDHSPGGYCLGWPKDVPGELQAGEIVGIQDHTAQGWSVAVVRWIHQVHSGGTRMGISLIAPQAQPCGLQLVRNHEEETPILRALLLPEISVLGLPATLIAPRLPFKEGQSVLIHNYGEERRATLGKRQDGTGSFNRFQYRIIDQPAEPSQVDTPKAGRPGESFDSLWKLL